MNSGLVLHKKERERERLTEGEREREGKKSLDHSNAIEALASFSHLVPRGGN